MTRLRGDGLRVCACGGRKDPDARRCKQCVKPRWKPNDDARLRRMVAKGIDYPVIAAILRRSVNGCQQRATGLGVKMPRALAEANRRAGLARFHGDPERMARMVARMRRQFTPEDRAMRAEEARRRMAKGTFGFKGRHHAEDTRERISKANKGRAKSAETRQKMSAAAKRRWDSRAEKLTLLEARKQGKLDQFIAERETVGDAEAFRKTLDSMAGVPRREEVVIMERKPMPDFATFRVQPRPKPSPEGKVWCEQCQQRVAPVQADACVSPWCKAK